MITQLAEVLCKTLFLKISQNKGKHLSNLSECLLTKDKLKNHRIYR